MSRRAVSKASARYLLSRLETDEAEARERVRRNSPGLAEWQETEQASALVLAALRGRLQYYAEPDKP